MITTVILKLSPKLKARITREARQRGKSMQRWMLEAIEREMERRQRFLDYVRTAQHAGIAADPVAELDAHQRMRFWLDQLAATRPGSNVTRLRPRKSTRSSG